MPESRIPRPWHREHAEEAPYVPRDLSGLFAPPRWLRDLGQSAWLLVGVTAFIIAVIWVLALTQTIVAPVITAGVVAAVASPVIHWLTRRGLGRGLAAAVFMLAGIAFGIGLVVLVVGGITNQLHAVSGELSSAKDTIAGWLQDIGISKTTADNANANATSAVNTAVPALLQGIGGGLKALSGLVVYLALTALSLFFLLMDGPRIRRWTEGHMRVPDDVAHQMTSRVLQSLRGYFLGVTLVAAFNAVVVGLGALVLGVPLVGTIVAVTFLGAYIPYLGAWSAGAFSVLVALGAGTDAAIGMIVVQLLANSILQQLVQPIAYGAALGIHPLAVLIVTIAGGALFGAVGLILAAPLTSAASHIAGDLSLNAPEPAAPPPDAGPATVAGEAPG
ncbi:MAG TPA: AI-2E family transporter [Solirubrobacteraceae bacterium]